MDGGRAARCVCADGAGTVCHGQAVGGGYGAAVWHTDAMAGFFADRRRGRHCAVAGQSPGPVVCQADARSAAWPSGAGPDHAELCGQRPGAGQRSHPHGAEGHEGIAVLEPQARYSHECANSVFGAECFVADAAACHHFHVPHAAGGHRPHAGVFTDFAGHFGIDPGGAALGGAGAALAAVQPGGAGLPAAGGAGPGGFHGAADHTQCRSAGIAVVAAG